MSTYDQEWRKAKRKIESQQNAIKQAIFYCRYGIYTPEQGNGLEFILSYLGYSEMNVPTEDGYKFDPDKIHELVHEFGIGPGSVALWIERAEAVKKTNT